MEQFVLTDHPHRRYNPLLDEWILVSPQRAKKTLARPKQKPFRRKKPEYDKTCYLCPGNQNASLVEPIQNMKIVMFFLTMISLHF